MTRPAVVPVNLGCCPVGPRCRLCPPAPEPPEPSTVRALIHHTRAERAAPGQPVQVSFFGGAPPSPALLSATGDLPTTVRVRPDLLTRAEARRLAEAGVGAVELDLLTLHTRPLREVGRTHRRALVLEQLEGLRAMGLRVGAVLAPGLPGATFEQSLDDARTLAPLLDTVRIHPVLVLHGARLKRAHMDGTYTPLTLGEAVTVCRALLDVFEPAGVRVLRVGQQPGPDGLGRAVAGPHHPSLRELVESRRALDTLRQLLDAERPAGHVVVQCAPADVSRTRGPFNQHVRTLRAEFALDGLSVQPDPALPRGRWRVIEATG
jgi:hypothetical protein